MALDVVRTEPVLKLIRDRPKVDVLINMSPGNAFFAELFDCPIIQFSPAGPMSLMMKGTTNVINNSIQPFITAPFIEPMTFLNRLHNQALTVFVSLFFDWQVYSQFPYQQEFLRTELGVEITDPSVTNERRMALMIGGSHPVTHGAWQYLPNVIEAGGLQLQPAKPLPTDLQTFMDSATGGAVLVSFGSSLKPDQMPPEKIQMFVDTFKQLPAGVKVGRRRKAADWQLVTHGVQVIWKWDAELPGLPDNVMLR
jgi:glucuronosyltransferase